MKEIFTSKTGYRQYISLWLTQQMQRRIYVSQTLLSQQMLQSCHWHRRLLSPQICILGENFRTTDTTVPTEPHLLAELLFRVLFCLQQMWETARTTGISVTANLHLQGIKLQLKLLFFPSPQRGQYWQGGSNINHGKHDAGHLEHPH